MKLEEILGMIHFYSYKNISGCKFTVVIPSLTHHKITFKDKKLEVPTTITYKNTTFIIWDDFYDYKGIKNNDKDIRKYLRNYKNFVHVKHNTFTKVYFREEK